MADAKTFAEAVSVRVMPKTLMKRRTSSGIRRDFINAPFVLGGQKRDVKTTAWGTYRWKPDGANMFHAFIKVNPPILLQSGSAAIRFVMSFLSER